MDFNSVHNKIKVVFIMGATGTGKSLLAVQLAYRLSELDLCQSEVINCDKMQVYKGLDLTTNKVTAGEQHDIPHHLLSSVDASEEEFSASKFRLEAASLISDINSRGNLPIVVGGSNSFIYALAVQQFNPELDVFHEATQLSDISSELMYNCCFLWLDVSSPVLLEYSSERVDSFLRSDAVLAELAEFINRRAGDSESRNALWKAIGVPEFEVYFKTYPPPGGLDRNWEGNKDPVRKAAYEEAVTAIKGNTWRLVERQMRKIQKLKEAGWVLHRLDATEVFQTPATCREDKWKELVLKPSLKIVNNFFHVR